MDSQEKFQSKLGKKEYWDSFYEEEINQFGNNDQLIGEIWFGKQVQNKTVAFIKETVNRETKILDVGCGNSAFLIKLAKEGYSNLFGMDYSEKSIALSTEIIAKKAEEEKYEKVKDIRLFVDDFNNINNKGEGEFDLIHDKGTFDAFMLREGNCHTTYATYITTKVKNNNETFFIITSCNHLRKELESFFVTPGGCFEIVKELPNKSFTFGGNTGQTVTTLVFKVYAK